MTITRHISDLLGLGPGPTRVLIGLVALLVLGTALRGIRRATRPDELAVRRWRSLGTWWALLALFVAMLALGRWAVAVAMAGLALLALRESLRLARPDTRFLAVTVPFVGPAFAVAVAWLPPPATRPGTGLGWLVLLLVLTELNDIAQAFWGRTLGRSPMAPELSPNKTWEGFWGGVLTTAATAVLVAPFLTDYGRAIPPEAGATADAPAWVWSAVAGTLVAVAGVAGDLLASRLKRRAGADDSGRLLPGQGGVLDRLDSLTVTAPTFFALTWFLWIQP